MAERSAALRGLPVHQSKDRFPLGGLLASFVVTEARKTVFVGLYRVDGVKTLPPDSVDVLSGHDTSGHFVYDLRLLDEMSDYRDRVVIDWGAGVRTWVQHAEGKAKPVVEIAEQYEPRFPGFREFVRSVDDVPTLPNGWQQVLRSVKGVYLLVDVESGRQYVGSAKGTESLLGRWLTYAEDGHGGNIGLKEAARTGRRRYQVSVLEIVDENTPDDTIELIESHWKNKLLSRQYGLNRG